MNHLKTPFALVIAALAAGCGQQLLQFGDADVDVDAAADLSMADMAVAPDARLPDMAMPTDLAMTDLSTPDLSTPDLSTPDLLSPDLLTPDLLMPDLLTLDLLTPDLLTPDLLPPGPGPLGSLEGYAILASATVTNTGASVIIGNIGLSPGPVISGIPPGMPINGAIHVADGPAAQAQMDLTFAYDFMAGKACGTNLTGMDLGGKTLAPGVYCFDIDAGIAIGSTLILDAQGDPDASWTFQIASTLILGDFAKVFVINGGRDCSVAWQVGSSATLGIGARVAGSILAQASITMTKGASVGRALARTGGVTMDTNDVAVGPCR